MAKIIPQHFTIGPVGYMYVLDQYGGIWIRHISGGNWRRIGELPDENEGAEEQQLFEQTDEPGEEDNDTVWVTRLD